jgi:hypothetical protein
VRERVESVTRYSISSEEKERKAKERVLARRMRRGRRREKE